MRAHGYLHALMTREDTTLLNKGGGDNRMS